MPSGRQTWFGTLFFVLVVGCVRPDASHCGNQGGDATCAERDPSRAHCSVCTATNDGCVTEFVAPDCTPPQGGDSSTSTNAIVTSVGGDDDPSMTSDPLTAGDASVGEDTTSVALTGATTSSASEEDSTSDVGTTDGEETTSFASSESSSDMGPECGNGIQEADEQCDEMDLNGQTCAEHPMFAGGTLACDAFCMINTTGCTACVPAAGGCTNDDQCCMGANCNLGLCVL